MVCSEESDIKKATGIMKQIAPSCKFVDDSGGYGDGDGCVHYGVVDGDGYGDDRQRASQRWQKIWHLTCASHAPPTRTILQRQIMV